MGLITDLMSGATAVSGPLSDVGNFFLQNRALDQQRALQDQTWQREDSAVQRRVADLRAAGLSPTLAAGSAATTSQAMSPIVPRIGNDTGDKLAMAMSMIKQKADISKTEVEKEVMELQKNKTLIETANAAKQGTNIDLNNAIMAYDFDLAKKHGVRYDIKGGIQSQIQQAASAIEKAGGTFAGPALESVKKVLKAPLGGNSQAEIDRLNLLMRRWEDVETKPAEPGRSMTGRSR